MSARPRSIRPVTTVIVAAALAMLAFLAAATIAAAEIAGPCGATLNGVDASKVNSGNRADDIHVTEDASVPVVFTTASGFASHKLQLEFVGRRWTVSEKQDNGAKEFTEQANVADYATYGVGLYKVVGAATLTDGTTCSGAATVDVAGNPLGTIAGAAAAGAVALGTVMGLASMAMSASEVPVARGVPGSPVRVPRPVNVDQDHARRDAEMDHRLDEKYVKPVLGCASMLPVALLFALLLLPAMAISAVVMPVLAVAGAGTACPGAARCASPGGRTSRCSASPAACSPGRAWWCCSSSTRSHTRRCGWSSRCCS